MLRLNDLQLASLLDEIGASMKLDIPISESMRRLGSRRLGRVAKAAHRIADDIDSGQSTADAIKLGNESERNPVAAVVAACEKMGDSRLLNSVAEQLRIRHNAAKMTRLTWLYPLLLAAVAYVIGVFVMAPIILANQGQGVLWPPWVYFLCQKLTEHYWIAPLVGLTLVGILFFVMTMRQSLSTPAAQDLFCLSLADQIDHGVPETEAIQLAAEIAGLDDRLDPKTSTMDDTYIQRLLNNTGNPIEGLVVQEQSGHVARLRFASAYYRTQARKTEYLWGQLIPRIALVFIGAGCTLAYAWWVIRPVYQQVAQW